MSRPAKSRDSHRTHAIPGTNRWRRGYQKLRRAELQRAALGQGREAHKFAFVFDHTTSITEERPTVGERITSVAVASSEGLLKTPGLP